MAAHSDGGAHRGFGVHRRLAAQQKLALNDAIIRCGRKEELAGNSSAVRNSIAQVGNVPRCTPYTGEHRTQVSTSHRMHNPCAAGRASAGCRSTHITSQGLPRRRAPFCAASPACSPSPAPRARTPAAPFPQGPAFVAPPPEATGQRARRRPPCRRAARLPRR